MKWLLAGVAVIAGAGVALWQWYEHEDPFLKKAETLVKLRGDNQDPVALARAMKLTFDAQG